MWWGNLHLKFSYLLGRLTGLPEVSGGNNTEQSSLGILALGGTFCIQGSIQRGMCSVSDFKGPLMVLVPWIVCCLFEPVNEGLISSHKTIPSVHVVCSMLFQEHLGAFATFVKREVTSELRIIRVRRNSGKLPPSTTVRIGIFTSISLWIYYFLSALARAFL